MLKWILTTFCFLVITHTLTAQDEDKQRVTHLISLGFGFDVTAGDFGKRFGKADANGAVVDRGSSRRVVLSWELKYPNNWIFGIEGNYLFGGSVTEAELGSNLITSAGTVTGSSGFPAIVDPSMRAWAVRVNAGYQFPSPKLGGGGILVKGGLGFLEHKIRFDVKGELVPQLEGEYLKGYDRLSNGLLFTQFIGYQFLDEKRLKNFFVGFEFMQGFTAGRRSFNFDTQDEADDNRLELFFGLKLGWILPIYGGGTRDVYYYD